MTFHLSFRVIYLFLIADKLVSNRFWFAMELQSMRGDLSVAFLVVNIHVSKVKGLLIGQCTSKPAVNMAKLYFAFPPSYTSTLHVILEQ